MEFFIQALGLLGMVMILVSFQFKKQTSVIRVQLVSSLVFAVHYLLLGAPTGAILNLIGIGRAYVFSNKERPWARWRGWVPCFCGAYILVYLFTCSAGSAVLELLPVAGSIVTVIAFRLDNITMRKLSLLNGLSWLIYNIISGSIGGSLTEAFGMLSILVGLWRLKKSK